mmetsp:Transcript_98373/g.234185  ORF Transcript_98373/g.234185 Transcript_98373/m.234185 type:complete len:83 (-) Transcript_98373:177-425(-)
MFLVCMALFDTLLRSERKASEPRKCLGEELYILCDSRLSDLQGSRSRSFLPITCSEVGISGKFGLQRRIASLRSKCYEYRND